MSEDHNGHQHPEFVDDPGQSYYARRARAIEALLLEKGICRPKEIQDMVDQVEVRSPADGARVVARAWVNPNFKAHLLADSKGALEELGYTLPDTTPQLSVVENTENVHHLVVCTLCSCYPRALLGRPPRLVQEPGLSLPGGGGATVGNAGIRAEC